MLPPISFIILPILAAFLLIQLGLIARGIADLSMEVNGWYGYYGYPQYTDPNSVPNLSQFSNLFNSPLTVTTTQVSSESSSSSSSSSESLPSASAVSFSSASQPQTTGTRTGRHGSTNSQSLSGMSLATYDTASYQSQLNSILSQYSIATNDRRGELQPTGVLPLERDLKPMPTSAPLIVREIVQQSFDKETKLVKRSYLDDFKSKMQATLAFFVFQLLCILGLFGLIIAFLLEHRKFHKGGFTYESHEFFHTFFRYFAIATGIFFLIGLISFALLGSFLDGYIFDVGAAQVSFWVLSVCLLLGFLFTLKWDAKKMEAKEGEVVPMEKTMNDGGESGQQQVHQEVLPQQHVQQQQQQQQQQPVINISEPYGQHQ